MSVWLIELLFYRLWKWLKTQYYWIERLEWMWIVKSGSLPTLLQDPYVHLVNGPSEPSTGWVRDMLCDCRISETVNLWLRIISLEKSIISCVFVRLWLCELWIVNWCDCVTVNQNRMVMPEPMDSDIYCSYRTWNVYQLNPNCSESHLISELVSWNELNSLNQAVSMCIILNWSIYWIWFW